MGSVWYRPGSAGYESRHIERPACMYRARQVCRQLPALPFCCQVGKGHLGPSNYGWLPRCKSKSDRTAASCILLPLFGECGRHLAADSNGCKPATGSPEGFAISHGLPFALRRQGTVKSLAARAPGPAFLGPCHGFPAFRALLPVAGHSHFMFYLFPAIGTHAVTAGAGGESAASAAATLAAPSSLTCSRALSPRTCSISSRHVSLLSIFIEFPTLQFPPNRNTHQQLSCLDGPAKEFAKGRPLFEGGRPAPEGGSILKLIYPVCGKGIPSYPVH